VSCPTQSACRRVEAHAALVRDPARGTGAPCRLVGNAQRARATDALLAMPEAGRGGGGGREAAAARGAEEPPLNWPAGLVFCRSFTISDVTAAVNRDTPFLIFLGTPRYARARVRRAPCIRHVVQT
jgi:hypothetical protein